MKEYPAKWIEALRSGKYTQAFRMLRDSEGGGFCCLGVLCDTIDPNRWKTKNCGVSHWGKDETTALPQAVFERLGFKSNVGCAYDVPLPFRDRSNGMFYLTTLNDEGVPFAQIADLIEHFWQVL